ncbi:PepSY domain-containing protein [Bradyrhizobium sp. 24]|uniref:PepSY domain-containing protein n=1 Tax=unclassified Bradyrhizobium TaxID=2631580 RepID=UPI001FF83BF8|nr:MULTISPECIES: PepSY domain-containing protein [unclassified Bradyrhizobium]MCK1296822.1 PepSY domain-containing protein [Bradyrhizobium sp. 37]MCK1380177.1 PepSY domain-containing protein [Bradyrhizobium sp. 24]MCK1769058.1 PepSY domain-containing protein [Bradyrhizobium sp. 134]
MMDALVLLHRWLGIAFCLLFAMWFATGIVMHFVPFPSLTETERFTGLAPVDRTQVAVLVSDAVAVSGMADVRRVRLIQRSDGPIYIVSGPSRLRAIQASDGTDATVISDVLALAVAQDYARNRGKQAPRAVVVARSDYDQWSVPNGFDRHRPLFRVALGDAAGTEIYVSSSTGEVVLDTTRSERWWNLAGSVLHWIYPTALRINWSLWDKIVWTLSLLGLIAALSGAWVGIVRTRARQGMAISPYRGWHAIHHVAGLLSMMFILTWIFSGWLSMDHGRLFSGGQMTKDETDIATAALPWDAFAPARWEPISSSTKEVEWFGFNGHPYRRDRIDLDRQIMVEIDADSGDRTGFLDLREIELLLARLSANCDVPSPLGEYDAYAATSAMPGAPVYRCKCRDVWFDIDSATGVVLQRLDRSRRSYRWLYSGLHTLDFPILLAHPSLRSGLIVGLCSFGLLFSLTGIVLGSRRLRQVV